MRPNVRTNDVTRLCLLTKVNDEYYSQITSGHHFRVCVYMNSNVITLWSNQCMPHSHVILYWNNNKTHPSLVHSRETINTGPTRGTRGFGRLEIPVRLSRGSVCNEANSAINTLITLRSGETTRHQLGSNKNNLLRVYMGPTVTSADRVDKPAALCLINTRSLRSNANIALTPTSYVTTCRNMTWTLGA